jgi:hypothetical protein
MGRVGWNRVPYYGLDHWHRVIDLAGNLLYPQIEFPLS